MFLTIILPLRRKLWKYPDLHVTVFIRDCFGRLCVSADYYHQLHVLVIRYNCAGSPKFSPAQLPKALMGLHVPRPENLLQGFHVPYDVQGHFPLSRAPRCTQHYVV